MRKNKAYDGDGRVIRDLLKVSGWNEEMGGRGWTHRCACALIRNDGIFDNEGVEHHGLSGACVTQRPGDVELVRDRG
jgi:hypothetical protein